MSSCLFNCGGDHSFLDCPRLKHVLSSRSSLSEIISSSLSKSTYPTPTSCPGCRVVHSTWDRQANGTMLWKILKQPCPKHQPPPEEPSSSSQESSATDDINEYEPSTSPLVNAVLSALSVPTPLPASSPSSPVLPSPPGPSNSKRQRGRQLTYRKKETVEQALMMYARVRHRVRLGDTLTRTLKFMGISFPTYMRIHRPLGEAQALIPHFIDKKKDLVACRVAKHVCMELRGIPEEVFKQARESGLIL